MTDDDATPTAFDGLALPDERRAPRPSFARDLRRRVVDALDLDEPPPPTIDLPARRTRSSAMTPTVAVPYLTASDAAAAIDWYVAAFDAVEEFRVVDDAGRIGHAQFLVGEARFMLSDEYVDMGVVSPTTLGGTGTAIHLTVPDIDARFARAVAAGATSLGEPEDQPHGARHGTIVDPFGHRWMLSQDLEAFDVDEYAARSAGSEWSVVAATGPAPAPATTGGGIWAVATYADAPAGIRFLVDVLGFEEQLVVPDEADPSQVVHSELRWPEGGIVQVASASPDHDLLATLAPGDQTLYVVTADPRAVLARCEAAGVEFVREPEAPHYDPDGLTFAVRDPEGNTWSFGSYAGEGATTPEDRPTTEASARATHRGDGSVWAGVFYRDAAAGIRFLVDVLGFQERLVVTDEADPGTVVHSQFTWPEGGVVSATTYDPASPYAVAPGDQRLYVVTSDPHAVYDRCTAAGLEVVQEPYTPDYDPDGMGFGVKDPEGNIWSVGSYEGAI